MPCSLSIRSEEHTSELQSHSHLVCRLLLEKKKYVLCELFQSIAHQLAKIVLVFGDQDRLFFFFNDAPTTEIYPLSLPGALPISPPHSSWATSRRPPSASRRSARPFRREVRSEEHTSELQSHSHLVCRLLLE